MPSTNDKSSSTFKLFVPSTAGEVTELGRQTQYEVKVTPVKGSARLGGSGRVSSDNVDELVGALNKLFVEDAKNGTTPPSTNLKKNKAASASTSNAYLPIFLPSNDKKAFFKSR